MRDRNTAAPRYSRAEDIAIRPICRKSSTATPDAGRTGATVTATEAAATHRKSYCSLSNNEVEADGRQRGSWLIDDKGVKQPAYETHASFLAWARRHAAETISRSGHPPSAAEFRAAAIASLGATPAGGE